MMNKDKISQAQDQLPEDSQGTKNQKPEELTREVIKAAELRSIERSFSLIWTYWRQKSLKFLGIIITSAIIIAHHIHPAWLILGVICIFSCPETDYFSSSEQSQVPEQESLDFRIYRQAELTRITAALLANSAILIVGEEGSGKTVLANGVFEKLQTDGFVVTLIQPASSKQMHLQICDDFNIPTETLEGKSLTISKLKQAIADFLKNHPAFMIVDDAQTCEYKFRLWLKELRKQGVPMLVLASAPPRSDIFINIPRIELKPLPEYAIRQIMQQAARERGIELRSPDFARLQQRASGNPTLAIRAIEEEYLGVEIEAGDHSRYFDIIPIILFLGIIFVIIRFIGLGTNQYALYILGSIVASVFLGISRLLHQLPREHQRIR